MATKINTRSPFYVKYTDDDATYTLKTVQLDIWVYEDAVDDWGTRAYRIQKNVISSNNFVVFEISELVRDYINIVFDGDYDSNTTTVKWVRLVALGTDVSGNSVNIDPSSTQYYVATDGYGYFEDGINPELSRTYLQSNYKVFRLDDQNVRVPIFAEDTNSVSFLYQGKLKRTKLITDNGLSENKIQYITVSGSDNTDTYKERVLASGGTFEDNTLLDAFLDSVDIGLVDELYINSDSGTEVIKISTEPCSKYEPYKVTFINKFGALQDMYFSLKSIESLNTTGETYKANVVDFGTLTYDTYKPQVAQYNKLGKESITLNTNYISEDYNEVIKQLMMSEQVWLTRLDNPAPNSTNPETVLAVMPKTQSVIYKTSLNDRLVQYTVDFDYAFDKINTVR